MYTIQFYWDKFSAIPENEWTVGVQQNEKGQRCAVGHTMPLELKSLGFGNHASAMDREVDALLHFDFPTEENFQYCKDIGSRWVLEAKIHRVNNGDNINFQQPTPKQRVLAALKYLQDLESERLIQEALKTEDLVEA